MHRAEHDALVRRLTRLFKVRRKAHRRRTRGQRRRPPNGVPRW